MDSVIREVPSANNCSKPNPRLFVQSLKECIKERSKEKKRDRKVAFATAMEVKAESLLQNYNDHLVKKEPLLQHFDHCESIIESPIKRNDRSNILKLTESLRHHPCNEDTSIAKYFNKIYEFKTLTDNKQLKPSEFFVSQKWQVTELMDLKLKLNEVKSQLNNFNLHDWHNHTKLMNVAADVQKYLKKEIEPELLTQAWCKFHEVVASKYLIPKKAIEELKKLNSVHLCEAPGAFITSLNHYLRTKHMAVEWNWLASTLNPHHEQNEHSCMINDDRLILNTLERWNFGVDCTGNIFKYENMKEIVNQAQQNFSDGVLLVTADGSMDCQSSPGDQESMVCPLLYCEVITAISVLKTGGSLLLKMFTMFECETICLLYLLYMLFGSVTVFKPATSKEGNSEVYVVCLYYNQPTNFEEVFKVLSGNYGMDITNKVMFDRKTIPDEFITQIVECASYFESLQEKVIERNIKFFKGISNNEKADLRNLQDSIAKEYVRRYQVERLIHSPVVGIQSLKDVLLWNIDDKMDEGSFNDQQSKLKMDLNLRLIMLQDSLKKVRDFKYIYAKDTIWFEFPDETNFYTQVGLSVTTINNSKFCSGFLLKILNELVTKLGSTSYKSEDKSLHPALTICDVSQLSWFSTHYFAKSIGMKNILEKLSVMQDKSNFILIGFPLLTQFNVGLVYVIGHVFEKVGFANPKSSGYSILFTGFKKKNFDKMHNQLEEIKNNCNSNSTASVLSIVPIKCLCEKEFYITVLATNHIFLKNYIDQRISESLTK